MARRTKDELRRLGALCDAWRDYELAHSPPSTRERSSHTTRSSEDWIAGILESDGSRLNEWVTGFQQAVNDTSEQIGDALEQGWPEGRGFLIHYRERTGRDWWADAGDTAKMARTILRRGRIRNETEWYLLENILTNVDQTVFSAAEAERLEAMRQRFEEKVSGRAQKS
jgi:hypothetical protein